MTKQDKPKPLITFALTSEGLIAFCHDEIVALASKMAEYEKSKS